MGYRLINILMYTKLFFAESYASPFAFFAVKKNHRLIQPQKKKTIFMQFEFNWYNSLS
jgi:hypothetical protein